MSRRRNSDTHGSTTVYAGPPADPRGGHQFGRYKRAADKARQDPQRHENRRMLNGRSGVPITLPEVSILKDKD